MKHWILAARPKTLLAGFCPVAMGTVLAFRDDAFHFFSALAAFVGAMAIQIGTNLCNDYCDFFQGADTTKRKGPTRAVQAGLITAKQMLVATIVTFCVAALASCYLASRAGWPIAVLAAISIFLGVMYTAGRYSLAYLGLGDSFAFLFFGPIAVAGTHYVQALELSANALIAGCVPGFLSVCILVVNNLRDVEEDRVAGKKTLAVRFGVSFARVEYTVCMFGALLVPVVLWRHGSMNFAVTSCMLTIVPGLVIAAKVWKNNGTALNPFLGQTALVLLCYTLVFSLGCVFVW